MRLLKSCCLVVALLVAGSLFGQENILAKQAAEVQQGKTRANDLLARYNEMIRREPTNPLGYVLAAAVYDRDESKGLYEKAISLSPDYIPAHVGLARFQARRWNFASAFPEFQKALALLPSDKTLRLEAVRAAARSSHMAEARTLAGDDVEYKTEIVQALLDGKSNDEATKLFNELGLESRTEAVVLAAKGRLKFLSSKTVEQRQQGLNLIYESWQKDPGLVLHYKATFPRESSYQILLKGGRRKEAQLLLETGTQKYPTEYSLYEPQWKSWFTEVKADYSKERAAVHAKVEQLLKSPSSPELLKVAALGYVMANDDAAAEKINQQILSEFPYSDAARTVRRIQIGRSKDLRKKADLLASYNEDFVSMQAYNEYFATLDELNVSNEELLKGAELYLAKYQFRYLAVYDIGQVFVRRGIYLDRLQKWLDEVDKSQDIADKGNTIDAWAARLQAIRGKLLMLRGHPEQGEKLLRRVVNLKTQGYGNVDNGRAKYYLGEVLLALGKKDEALDMLAQGYAESQHYYAESGVKFRKLYVELKGSEKGMDDYLGIREGMLQVDAGGGIERGSKVETPAPAFDLQSLQGGRVSLASLKGKVIILNFWATW